MVPVSAARAQRERHHVGSHSSDYGSRAGGRQGKAGGPRRGDAARSRGVRRCERSCTDRRALRGATVAGAEIVEGDLLDIGLVQRAVQGVSTVFFGYPVQDGLLDATANMAVAAREAGVTRLVNLVMLRSSLDAPTPRIDELPVRADLGLADGGAAGGGLENVRALAGAGLAAHGTIFLPWGSDGTVLPLVLGEGVARVAVGLLTDPSVAPWQRAPSDRRRADVAGDDRDIRASARSRGPLPGDLG